METLGTFQPLADKEKDSPGLVGRKNFSMVDISEKKDTQRRAVARGLFIAKKETIECIKNRALPKGDALVLAEASGIQGAKLTSTILPLCHPLQLTSVKVWTEVRQTEIEVFCEAKTIGKTGVEMEALCGVQAALLCLYDLTKGVDPALQIGGIHLELKEGGKSGLWIHPDFKNATHNVICSANEITSKEACKKKSLQEVTALVITLSDRSYKKQKQDYSGPIAENWLLSHKAKVLNSLILPDDFLILKNELKEAIHSKKVNLIITTGGTGISERDLTPEAVESLNGELKGKEIVGWGELLRLSGAKHNKMSWLSRSCAYMIKGCLILCLPGSPSAVRECLEDPTEVQDLILHCLHVANGGGHL